MIVSRGDVEIDESSSLAPHTAVVAGHHAKAIIAGTQIVIKRLAAITSLLPIAVAAFQFVSETDLFRGNEAQRRIVDLQIAYQRRQTHWPTFVRGRIVGFAIRNELFDLHRRLKVIEWKTTWIDDAYAVACREPQLAIR